MFSIDKPSFVISGNFFACYWSGETQQGQSEGWNTTMAWQEGSMKRFWTANSPAKCSNNSSGYQSRNYSWLGYQFGVSISLTGKSDPTDLCRMVMLQDQRFVGSISLVTLVIFLASTLAWIPVSTSPVNTKTWHLNDRCGNLAKDDAPFLDFRAWWFSGNCSPDIVTSQTLWSWKFHGKFTLPQWSFEFLTVIATMVVSKFLVETPEEAKGNQPIYACSERRLQWRVVSYLEPCVLTNCWMVLVVVLFAPTLVV